MEGGRKVGYVLGVWGGLGIGDGRGGLGEGEP